MTLSPHRQRHLADSARPYAVGQGGNLRGAALMCVAMTGYTLNDAVMKFVFTDLPFYQAITLRGLFVMLFLLLIAWRQDGGPKWRIPRAAMWPMALRAVGEVGSTLCFLTALRHMALGDLSAIMQSLPLAVMLAAAALFGERLGWRRITAVLVGLVGVMMILRPGTAAFTTWSLFGLGAVALVVMRDMVTRLFTPGVTSATIALYAGGAVTLTALVLSLPQGWAIPRLGQIALLALAAAFLTAGYLAAVATMRVGEISFVAPFRYVSLVVAILAGLLVFGDWPDGWTWAGAGLVVTAGIYSIWREARVRKEGA